LLTSDIAVATDVLSFDRCRPLSTAARVGSLKPDSFKQDKIAVPEDLRE
jgi:hypothetical protein